jgi:hypothetical protein
MKSSGACRFTWRVLASPPALIATRGPPAAVTSFTGRMVA